MFFIGNIPKIVLRKGEYTKTMDRVLGQVVREAAREWIRAWLLEGIPVETGMAKATLQPISRYLKNVFTEGINPTRKPYFSQLEGVEQSISSGHDKTSFTVQDDKTHPLFFIYEYAWSTEVLHYFHKEFYNGSATVGEDAIKIAEAAYIAHVEATIAHRLPKLVEYMDFDSAFTQVGF